MEIKYNVTGTDRKELVKAISEITGAKAEYKGAPTFNYEVDYFTIDRSGAVAFDDRADSEEIENLIDELDNRGFTAEQADTEQTAETADISTISVPLSAVNKENLDNLLKAKGHLFAKALGIENPVVTYIDDLVSFPWLADTEPTTVDAVTYLVTAVCKMSREQKRINPAEKLTDNEKYAFRTFLLRLGFIGDDYKSARKILLKNFEGSSAFRNSRKV